MNTLNHSDEMAKSVAGVDSGGLAGSGAGAAGRAPSHEGPGAGQESEPVEGLVQFALRADGAILLNAAELKGWDLSGREFFVGVVLTPRETRHVMGLLSNAAAHAASMLVAKLRKALSRSNA